MFIHQCKHAAKKSLLFHQWRLSFCVIAAVGSAQIGAIAPFFDPVTPAHLLILEKRRGADNVDLESEA